ncbi:MAG: hypothetical protein FWG20_02155 [Candidatus Cloacimonetes bacterium]|nr:hypothetical protein [Candidatus Cloacimonadota bacterium]
MVGEWKVSKNIVKGREMYIAVRLRDVSVLEHDGNREYHGVYSSSADSVQKVCDELNRSENE